MGTFALCHTQVKTQTNPLGPDYDRFVPTMHKKTWDLTHGWSDMCLFGTYTERGIKGAHGYMGEYYSEAPAFMVKIPSAMRPFAVLLEPLSIVEKATFQAWRIQERMVWQPARAVVLGAGPIGILGTILLRLRGLEVHVYAKSAPQSLQGRILTDLGAVIMGGMGFAPSANLNPERTYPSMFESVHGSAPDIKGRGIANPLATIWAGQMMQEEMRKRAQEMGLPPGMLPG